MPACTIGGVGTDSMDAGTDAENARADSMDTDCTVYDAVGGQPFFDELVERFYARVEADELLRPLYPEALDAPRARLSGFLAQYWGGPARYSNERGHPRLRLRHAPFAISVHERDAWTECMSHALNSMDIPETIKRVMTRYFENTATSLINRTHPPIRRGDGTSRTVIAWREQ